MKGCIGLCLSAVQLGLPVLLFFSTWVSVSVEKDRGSIVLFRLSGFDFALGYSYGSAATDAGRLAFDEEALSKKEKRQGPVLVALGLIVLAVVLVCCTVHLTAVYSSARFSTAPPSHHPLLLRHGALLSYIVCGSQAGLIWMVFSQSERAFRTWTARGLTYEFTPWYWLQLASIVLLWFYWYGGLKGWKAGRIHGYGVPPDWGAP